METVRRAELVQETATSPVVGTGGTAGGSNSFCAAFGLDLVELFGNLFDSGVVVNLLPLAFALLANAL